MLMGICLVQTFQGGSTPDDPDIFQQIDGAGTTLSGKQVVIKVDNDGKGNVAFINTIVIVGSEQNSHSRYRHNCASGHHRHYHHWGQRIGRQHPHRADHRLAV